MEALKATIAKFQQDNAGEAVPPSISQPSMSAEDLGMPQRQAVPIELEELALDWGDFDPAFKQKVFTDATFRAEFIKFHSTDHTEVRIIPECQILTTEDYQRKRTRTDLTTPATAKPFAEDEDLSKTLMQYHQSEVLPQLETLRTARNQYYNIQEARHDQLSLRVMALQQQVASIERSRNRRTVILKNLSSPLYRKDVDSNLRALCSAAGYDSAHIEDTVNHLDHTAFHTILFATFITKMVHAAVKSTLKRGFWWNILLIYFTAYAVLNQTYYGNPACHFCKPLGLSKLSCLMSYCSVVHILGLSFGSSCTVTYLFDFRECSMSVMCFSRLIESIINDLINGCI